jgi:hypothetical protein
MVHLLAITVLTSASASTQTTILPTARTALSMAAFKAIPENFAKIHPRYLTPTDATVGMGLVSIVFYVGLTLISANILADTIAAVGLMIAFYYGLTGFACAWFYRRTMRNSTRDVIMQGVLPVIGGVILLGFFVYACHTYASSDYGYTHIGNIGGVFLLGVGSLVLGLILMFAWQLVRPDYFRGDTLPRRDSSDLILLQDQTHYGLRLPDSVENTVIAPDLSNLPPGATAVDLKTGDEVQVEPGQRYVDEGDAEREARERSAEGGDADG